MSALVATGTALSVVKFSTRASPFELSRVGAGREDLHVEDDRRAIVALARALVALDIDVVLGEGGDSKTHLAPQLSGESRDVVFTVALNNNNATLLGKSSFGSSQLELVTACDELRLDRERNFSVDGVASARTIGVGGLVNNLGGALRGGGALAIRAGLRISGESESVGSHEVDLRAGGGARLFFVGADSFVEVDSVEASHTATAYLAEVDVVRDRATKEHGLQGRGLHIVGD